MITTLLILIGALLLIFSLLGSVLPMLPGPPLAYLALWLLYFMPDYELSLTVLLFWGVVTLLVSVADYLIPVLTTKRFGGSRRAAWGSLIGMVVGLFLFPPIGLIVGVFAGAVIGELSLGKESDLALQSGLAAFLGFLFGTVLKLIASGMMIYVFIKTLLQAGAF